MKPYKFELTFKEGDALHVECSRQLSPVIMSRFSAWDNVALRQYNGRSGIYILIGADEGEDFTGMSYYIGQTTNLQQRLNDHRRKKEWIKTILFYTVDASAFEHDLQAYLQGLESLVIGKIRQSASLKNRVKTGGEFGNFKIKETDRPMLEDLINQFEAMVSALGYEQLFDSTDTNNDADETSKSRTNGIKCSMTNPQATGIMLPNGQFLVSKGSAVKQGGNANIDRSLKDQLCKEGVIKNGVFTTDYEFSSPSRAAIVLMDYSVNGLDVWKTEDGKSLKEYIK